jgi:DNA-binding LytR/AlgR family response regulator
LLLQSLSNAEPGVKIETILTSVREGLEYFSRPVTADIIFSDIQLTDGHSFGIFQQRKIRVPVVFITAYNEFMVNAFTCNGIDYLLKPVQEDDIRQALNKYRMLENHFGQQDNLDRLVQQLGHRRKTRLIVRRGMEFLSLKLDDVVLIHTEDKLVFVTDRFGKKYIAGKTMAEMETELDASLFFRANRQYIININFIKGFKPFEKVKLSVDMELPDARHAIIISQENAALFRQWMFDA